MNASRLRITFATVVSFMVMAVALLALGTFKNVAPAQADPSVIYVDRDAPGPAHNGQSWATAYTDVQQALTTAISGTEVWVAEGVYYPGVYVTSTFALTDGVALYGGFGGYGISETQRTQRDWAAHVTVLSGDIDHNDLTDANGIVTDTVNITGTNAYHVVTSSGVTRTAVLDGFAITAGRTRSSYPDNCGGGMYNERSYPALTNVFFSGNWADYGGGMYNGDSNPTLANVTFSGNQGNQGGGMHNGGSSPALTNVTFSGNQARYRGGGMSNYSSSNAALTNVTFSWNQVNYLGGGPTIYLGGGGIYNADSSPTLTNVTFSGNQVNWPGGATYNNLGGGGMYNGSNSNPTLTNVTFSGNQAKYSRGVGGGGMYNGSGSRATLTNVTFSGNQASYGGGMSNWSSSSPMLMNVTFSGNQAGRGGGMYNERSYPALTNVTFSGNRASGAGGGMSNRYGSNPTLTNVTFSGNQADEGGGGMENYSNSNPTLVNSILWGDSPDEIYNDVSVPTIAYSDVYTPTGVYSGMGNRNANPLFVAPITATTAPTTTGNYRLLTGSPAIDAGNTLSVTAATDLDGFPRISGTAVDMGAYEYSLRIYLPIVFKN